MHPLRLAYATQFLIAVIAAYVLWSQVGGQTHFDALPWYVTGGLILAAAFAIVKATHEAVNHDSSWNTGTLKWCAILLALIAACGMASLYAHDYLEDEEPGEGDTALSLLHRKR